MTTTSKEYGTALFALAQETQTQDEIADNLALVSAVFANTPGYMDFLASPGIAKKERLDTIGRTFSADVHEYVVSFLSLLCAHGYIHMLDDCIETYNRLYQESRRQSTATVISAVPLTEEEKARLRSILEAKSGHAVTLACSVDETLLGGMRVELDGLCMDGSLKHRLQNIKGVIDR